ncbi:hypothetical protein SAMN05446037_100182 [Anaerovirgula multivorans]|uniref:Uncharacterized protein n=1 Tax=Anaerovirgula multivorans TaxID=312168 RepID=A0A238ZUE8_9FIRM|nr:hypothetical protein [Anaerovirgula multivorans]SNR86283.1 hypothetical protein SAMN05446037_100182 [Anaerovirgula multivorans]
MLKKIGKVIGIIVGVLLILAGLMLISDSFGSAILLAGIGGAVIFVALKIGEPLKHSESKKPSVLETRLKEKGFEINKSLNLPKYTFFVDNTNKKFAYGNKKELKIYNYADLLNFELKEDGNTVTGGKGVATAVGAATFGVVGAAVGMSGKRKNKSTCTSLAVHISVNDLDNPHIPFNFIDGTEHKKDGFLYKDFFGKAQELVSILAYIENNK